MPYIAPVDAPISSSWQDHKDRKPPSSEPGTDYACGYGTTILAAAAGVVVDLKTTNGAATGRYLTLALDDGNTVRYLHLASVWVSVGQRISQGQGIAASGASANGNDWGTGAHVHTTLWIGPAWVTPTVDFTLYVLEDDVPLSGNDRQFIKDSIFEFYRDTTSPPPGHDDWPFFRHAVWAQPIAAQNADGTLERDDAGNQIRFSADGFMASTNALSHAIRDDVDALEPGPPTPPTRDLSRWLLAGVSLLVAISGIDLAVLVDLVVNR